MYRNSVSVIELVADENFSPLSNPSNAIHPESGSEPSVSGNESYLPLAVDQSSVNVSTETVTDEKTESDDFVSDKISFKQKMKEILSCRVCSELRRTPLYQCKYGHLLCAGCFNDIFSQSRLQNEIASCPVCQTTITTELCFRNVAAEETISELPVACSYCSNELSPRCIKFHEAVCKRRPTLCSNSVIGCSWEGPNTEKKMHEQECNQPSVSGYEVLKSLAAFDQEQKEGMDLYNKIMELLSVEKITYVDLQLKYCETEEQNIIFETSKFNAFDNQWLIHACLDKSQDDFKLSYQLISKTKPANPMNLQYIILCGPYSDMEIKPNVYQFKFSDKVLESTYNALEVSRTVDKEAFYSAKRINIRVLLFHVR